MDQTLSKPMLFAKFKESIKLKNSQIQTLKEALGKVEDFKLLSDNLKRELNELKKTHESWMVSLAENKLIVHQEIELKNAEIQTLKNEISDLQSKLVDTHNRNVQLRETIQDLESRLVRTSAAHQKERDSLTRELTIAKNNAIRNIQKEHELHVERVKLDLEKSIEALKMGMLTRDQQIMENAQYQQSLLDKNQELQSRLNRCNETISQCQKELENSRLEHNEKVNKTADSETMTDLVPNQEPTKEVEFEYLKNIGKLEFDKNKRYKYILHIFY